MPSGIRATVSFQTPDVCPVAELSAEHDVTVDSVTANVCPDDGTRSVTEFAVDADVDAESTDFTRVFSHGSSDRYRLPHDGDLGCPCECLGQFECPVDRYVAEDGTVTLVFHATGYENLQEIVAELRAQFPGVNIERFVRSPAGGPSGDAVFLDRSKLTDRQREVAETAYEMGYFDRPRGANATAVADELDIDPSTFSEHLAAAQSKILGDVL